MADQNRPPRLRVSHIIVQPVLVIDDGDELSPGPAMAPAQVRLSELPGLADTIRESIVRLEQQAHEGTNCGSVVGM